MDGVEMPPPKNPEQAPEKKLDAGEVAMKMIDLRRLADGMDRLSPGDAHRIFRTLSPEAAAELKRLVNENVPAIRVLENNEPADNSGQENKEVA